MHGELWMRFFRPFRYGMAVEFGKDFLIVPSSIFVSISLLVNFSVKFVIIRKDINYPFPRLKEWIINFKQRN